MLLSVTFQILQKITLTIPGYQPVNLCALNRWKQRSSPSTSVSGPALATGEIARARLRLPVCKKGGRVRERYSKWYAAAAFLGNVNMVVCSWQRSGSTGVFTDGLGARLLSAPGIIIAREIRRAWLIVQGLVRAASIVGQGRTAWPDTEGLHTFKTSLFFLPTSWPDISASGAVVRAVAGDGHRG